MMRQIRSRIPHLDWSLVLTSGPAQTTKQQNLMMPGLTKTPGETEMKMTWKESVYIMCHIIRNDTHVLTSMQELDPGDLATFNRFLPSSDDTSLQPKTRTDGHAGVNLAALILEKIGEHEDRQVVVDRDPSAEPDGSVELPAKVVEAYTRSVLRLPASCGR